MSYEFLLNVRIFQNFPKFQKKLCQNPRFQLNTKYSPLSVQPILPDNFPENLPLVPPENNSLASIEPMTPTEAEILLSSKLAEKRSSVLSDEQAEEVCTIHIILKIF